MSGREVWACESAGDGENGGEGRGGRFRSGHKRQRQDEKMNAKEFQRFRQVGENVGVEFKRGGNGAQADTFETICAFLNRFGGDLFLGVADDGAPVGLPVGAVEPMMRHIVKVAGDPQLMDPPFFLQPESFKIGGKWVVHVRVPSSADVHRFKGVVFDRRHEADVRVRETEAIAQLYIRKQEIYTERRVYSGIRKADLRLDLVPAVKAMAATFRPDHPWRRLGLDAFFHSARLFGRDAVTGKEGFNAAAVLLLGKDDVIADVFPAYRTDALLRAVNADRYDDRETISTNLIDAFGRLMAFGEKHLSDKFWLEGTTRVSLRGKILREVISNILVHREYSSAKPARFVIEKDRLWADNANRAAFHGLITPENVQPVSKNPILASFFKQIGNADELGSGTRNLFRYVRLYSGADPVLDEEDLFKVTIPLDASFDPESSSGSGVGALSDEIQSGIQNEIQKEIQRGALDSVDAEILRLLAGDGTLTSRQLAERQGCARITIAKHIRKLKAAGMLDREGGRARGVWKVLLPHAGSSDSSV